MGLIALILGVYVGTGLMCIPWIIMSHHAASSGFDEKLARQKRYERQLLERIAKAKEALERRRNPSQD